MAERAEADISQGPADSAKAKMASKAETREISPPMLDVHAPHEVLHTWKGLFIHIATIADRSGQFAFRMNTGSPNNRK